MVATAQGEGAQEMAGGGERTGTGCEHELGCVM